MAARAAAAETRAEADQQPACDDQQPPVRTVQRPPMMPLIPAIRPLPSHNRAAESPISSPPMAAEPGVKCSIRISSRAGVLRSLASRCYPLPTRMVAVGATRFSRLVPLDFVVHGQER